MVKYTTEDRRVFTRLTSRMPMRYKNLDTGITEQAFTRDISGSGLRFITSERVAKRNDSLEMWIEAPSSPDPVNIKGRVVWLKEVGMDVWDMGIHFSRARLLNISKACSYLNARSS